MRRRLWTELAPPITLAMILFMVVAVLFSILWGTMKYDMCREADYSRFVCVMMAFR